MKKIKNKHGITLIALIITIIVLLILAGVSLNLVAGSSGTIGKATKASSETLKAQAKEELEMELINVIAECHSKNEEVTPTKIQEGLEEGLQDIEIEEDLTGTYKNYDFEIDENFYVYITETEKENSAMQVQVETTKGTSYIVINATASSTEGNIVKYEYIIDGVTYSSTEPSYKIENLAPESNHTIKVTAYDEMQNKKTSQRITVQTEPRTYLYKAGDECTDITGGWTVAFIDGNNPEAGSGNKESNNIYLESYGTWCHYACYPNQLTDFSGYSKMIVELYDITSVVTDYQLVAIVVGEEIVKTFPPEETTMAPKIDVSQLTNKTVNFFIGAANGASARVKNVWLEK